MPKKIMRGVVVKAGVREKTITVLVEDTLTHARYKKVIRRSRKYHVHDEMGSCAEGQTVSFIECRPISKTKFWTIQY